MSSLGPLLALLVADFVLRSADSMAFQTGETLALLSSNHFEATPHFVNAASSTLSAAALVRIRQQINDDPNWRNVKDGSVSRETLAVFIQVRYFSASLRNC